MKLSVIIPVYRVEGTLDRCVESVVSQQVDDMEVILVDDGSPDQCPALCDRWAEKDARIRVIHKENGGLSDARNAGIATARGEYMTFVDSDDHLEADTLAPLLLLADDADIVEYSISDRLSLADHTYTDTNEYWLKAQAYLHTYACNKMYRSTLFADVRYPKGKVFEDAWTLPLLLKKARKVKTTARGFYHYCWNQEGITATATGQQLRQLLEAHLTNGMPMDDTYYLHLLNIQIDVCEQTGDEPTLAARTVDTGLFDGAAKLKAITNNILGINQLCKIIRFVHRFKKPSRW
jgi:glycosyltransferase involved in cell wall biosynthesis